MEHSLSEEATLDGMTRRSILLLKNLVLAIELFDVALALAVHDLELPNVVEL